jgi:Uma2 family endonuclease
MQLPIPTRYYTPEEYLELEEKAEYKHEYRNGKIIPMTGGTTNHNKIGYYVMQYAKNSEAKWVLSEYEREKSLLSLNSISFQIAFQDLYEGVNFEDKEE